ncbi:MAG: hypothetical protein PHQ23_08245 [Candidatus Wallbacteria bacterium]|nr:hypothetical protein [Candidatus Wallbacteria bacterium]
MPWIDKGNYHLYELTRDGRKESAGEARDALRSLFSESPVRVLLDFHQLPVFVEDIVDELLQLVRCTGRLDGRVVMTGVSDETLDKLKFTGLDTVIAVTGAFEEAEKILESAGGNQ